MAFGVLVDVPLLVGSFLVIYRYRDRISGRIRRLDAPPILLFVLTAIPLVVVEEQIDCMPSWCGRVAVPPTLPFILVEMTVMGVLIVYLRARSLRRVIVAFCIYGVLWEYFLGGLRGLTPSLEAVLIVPYVALGYAYISLIPVLVLMKRPTDPAGVEIPGGVTSETQPAARSGDGRALRFGRFGPRREERVRQTHGR
jgi:hypothetical protein